MENEIIQPSKFKSPLPMSPEESELSEKSRNAGGEMHLSDADNIRLMTLRHMRLSGFGEEDALHYAQLSREESKLHGETRLNDADDIRLMTFRHMSLSGFSREDALRFAQLQGEVDKKGIDQVSQDVRDRLSQFYERSAEYEKRMGLGVEEWMD